MNELDPPTESRILRWSIPIDGSSYPFELTGPIVHVGQCGDAELEFWTVDNPDAEAMQRRFIVVGTGHHYPADFRHRGSVISPGGGMFVWHLMEIPEIQGDPE